MSGGDLPREAADELYSATLEEFVERRAALAAGARAAGDAAAAKKIAGLRKPSRSAWVLNQLARSAPAAASELAELGAEFRAAQQSLDGAAIRELSVRRRKLLDALTRQAFTITGNAPSAALSDEVTATLGAALADPQVAGQLQAGTLERAVRADGLGLPGTPALTPVTPSPGSRRGPAKAAKPAPARSETQASSAAARAKAGRANADPGTADRPETPRAEAARAKAARAEAARAEAERASAERERHRRALAEAERRVAEADQEAAAAASAEREQEDAVRLAEEQLADSRNALSDARLRARRAISSQRYAQQALERFLAQQAAALPPPVP